MVIIRRFMPHDRHPTGAGASRERRQVFLDYLRIFAFGSVLVGHKFWAPLQAAMAAPPSPWHWPARLAWPWVRAGGVGVLVFFLVSGYIITHVLQRERTVEFLVRRAFRIYPLYLVAALAEFALLHATGKAPGAATLLWQISLLGDWAGAPYALGGVEWTLRLELGFYLLMAALKMIGLTGWRGGASLPWVYAALAVALLVFGPWPTHTAWTRGYFSVYFPCLLLGSAIQLGERGTVRWGVVTALGAAVLGLHYLGLRQWQPNWLHAHFALLALALFLLLWALRRHLPAPGWVLRLSELTYAVYLLHYWVFDALRDGALRLGLSAVTAQLLALAGLLALCAALVRWVEQPMIRLGRRLSQRLSAQ